MQVDRRRRGGLIDLARILVASSIRVVALTGAKFPPVRHSGFSRPQNLDENPKAEKLSIHYYVRPRGAAAGMAAANHRHGTPSQCRSSRPGKSRTHAQAPRAHHAEHRRAAQKAGNSPAKVIEVRHGA
jgi:hypothetical protein